MTASATRYVHTIFPTSRRGPHTSGPWNSLTFLRTSRIEIIYIYISGRTSRRKCFHVILNIRSTCTIMQYNTRVHCLREKSPSFPKRYASMYHSDISIKCYIIMESSTKEAALRRWRERERNRSSSSSRNS